MNNTNKITTKQLPRPKLRWTADGYGNYRAETDRIEARLYKPGRGWVGRAIIKPKFGYCGSGVAIENYSSLKQFKLHAEDAMAELEEGLDPLACIRAKMTEKFVPVHAVAVIGVAQHPGDRK